jgi:GTPase SAR1 family protein
MSVFDDVITFVVGTFSNISRAVSSTVSGMEDFIYVKIRGLPFIVLGARQTGKTTLIHWLQNNMQWEDAFEPEPTAAGGMAVDDFSARIEADQQLKLKPARDVGGETAMWETDWIELFRQAQPRGILFLVDHVDIYTHKDALNFVLQMIDDERDASKNLKAFFVVVNKADLWREKTTLDELRNSYKNEIKRLTNQASKLGYKWAFLEGSLLTGVGMRPAIQSFFNTLRPKPRQ